MTTMPAVIPAVALTSEQHERVARAVVNSTAALVMASMTAPLTDTEHTLVLELTKIADVFVEVLDALGTDETAHALSAL